MSEPTSDRPEPRGCTLADLIALTFGAAIAASLYWYSGSKDSITIAGRAAPPWYVWSNTFLELTQKGCVALTPVILLRRWQSGGPLRPVEYLPILTAFSQIELSMWHWPVFGILWEDPEFPGHTSVRPEAFQAWKLSMFAVGVVVALIVAFLRKRPRDWISGSLVALAWGRLTYAGEMAYQSWGNGLITSQGWPASTIRLLSATLVQGPMGVVNDLPLAIALVDLGRGRGRRRSWVEWATIWLVLPLPLFYQARYLATGWLERGGFDSGMAIHSGGWVVSLGLAYLLARRFETGWRQFLEGSPDDAGQEARYRGGRSD